MRTRLRPEAIAASCRRRVFWIPCCAQMPSVSRVRRASRTTPLANTIGRVCVGRSARYELQPERCGARHPAGLRPADPLGSRQCRDFAPGRLGARFPRRRARRPQRAPWILTNEEGGFRPPPIPLNQAGINGTASAGSAEQYRSCNPIPCCRRDRSGSGARWNWRSWHWPSCRRSR